jgi:hypothetical protein
MMLQPPERSNRQGCDAPRSCTTPHGRCTLMTMRTVMMISLRRPLIALAVSIMLAAAAIGTVYCQDASNSPPTAAEAASAIADANAAIIFQSATSHDNVVEVQYKATAARLFPRNKAEREQRRLRLTLFFCSLPRITRALGNGVVIHQILVSPDNDDPFEFMIDQSSCATILEDAAANRRQYFESRRPTEPNHVRTLTIRPKADEK